MGLHICVFDSHRYDLLSQRIHAISSCTSPPMLVPHDTKVPVLTVPVCQCSFDSTNSSSWHSPSAFDRYRRHHNYHLKQSWLSCQFLRNNFIMTVTGSRAGSAVSLSETTSSQVSLQVELAQLTVSQQCCTDAGATALMAAAGKGRLHELSMLLAAGATLELQSKGGTAREWALRFGHTEAAEMLQLHEEAGEAADAAAGGAIALSHYQASSHRQLCLPQLHVESIF